MTPRAVAPATISFWRASSMLFTPAVCQTAIVSITGATVPSHRILLESNLMPGLPIACAAGNRFCTMAIVVPSRGAWL